MKNEEYKGCFNDVFEALEENGETTSGAFGYDPNEENLSMLLYKNFKKLKTSQKFKICFLRAIGIACIYFLLPLGYMFDFFFHRKFAKSFEAKYNCKISGLAWRLFYLGLIIIFLPIFSMPKCLLYIQMFNIQ